MIHLLHLLLPRLLRLLNSPLLRLSDLLTPLMLRLRDLLPIRIRRPLSRRIPLCGAPIVGLFYRVGTAIWCRLRGFLLLGGEGAAEGAEEVEVETRRGVGAGRVRGRFRVAGVLVLGEVLGLLVGLEGLLGGLLFGEGTGHGVWRDGVMCSMIMSMVLGGDSAGNGSDRSGCQLISCPYGLCSDDANIRPAADSSTCTCPWCWSTSSSALCVRWVMLMCSMTSWAPLPSPMHEPSVNQTEPVFACGCGIESRSILDPEIPCHHLGGAVPGSGG